MLAAIKQGLEEAIKVEEQVSDYVSDQVSDYVSEQVKILIAQMGKAPEKAYSVTELLQLLELKHRPTFRKNYLNPALEAQLIEMTEPNSPKSPKQKYRLSVKGLSYHGRQPSK